MKLRIPLIFKVVGLFVLVLLTITTLIGCWIRRTEENCWKHEAVEAFEKYGALRTRSGIVRVAYLEEDPGTNPLEVIEKDPNGCSFGSNGQTIILFSFDIKNKLTKIQVFRNYIASDYTMDLIEERKY